MSVLTRSQLVSAQRLLDRGLRLSEIAARLGISFEAACPGLFGGNQSGKGDDDGRDATGQPDLLGDSGADGAAGDDAADAPLAAPAPAQPVSLGVREEGGAPSAPEPAGPPEPPGEPAAPVAVPGQRFRLVSPHGESLHESERVLTRLPRFFWRGDADAVAALRRRRPQWAGLRAMAILSGSGAADATD